MQLQWWLSYALGQYEKTGFFLCAGGWGGGRTKSKSIEVGDTNGPRDIRQLKERDLGARV